MPGSYKFINAPKPAPAVPPPTAPAPATGGGGGSFMTRAARKLNQAVKPPTAPAPAPAPALTPQQQQAALVPGLDNRALDSLHTYALSEGPSPWLKIAEEKQKADEAAQLDLTAKQGAGAMAEARDALAMRGGLSGGSAENLAARNMDATLLGQQSVRGQGATQRLGLAMDDENRKMNILQNLPGQNLNVWSEGMKVQGANAMADAIRNSGGGGPLGLGDPGQSLVNKLPSGPGRELASGWNKLSTLNPVLDPTGGFITGNNVAKTFKKPDWFTY